MHWAAGVGVIPWGAVKYSTDLLTVKVEPQAGVATWAGGRTDILPTKAEAPDKDPHLPDEKVNLLCMEQAQGRANGRGSLNKGFGWIKPKDEKVLKCPYHETGLNRASADNIQR